MIAGRCRWISVLTIFLLTAPAVASATASSRTEPEVRGGLRVELESGEAVEMPLVGLGVEADVNGAIATVRVEQTYENPFDARIEAVYTFPLPEDAAVIDMVMVIGERRIRGELQEREAARRTYERARERGQTTSLLEQERPNIFTQSVANIEPGHPVRVLITYVEQLPYADGRYRFAFPMVVGPRFIPGAPVGQSGTGVLQDTDIVADASRITPPILPENVAAPYEVDFHLRIDAGMTIRELISSSHSIEADWPSDSEVEVTLPPDERQPNRDVVVEYALAEDAPELGLLSHYDERGGFFSLQLEPPARAPAEDVRPKELVFVIDMSGSMHGQPLETSKAAIRHALSLLNRDDTFRVVRFSDSASQLSAVPLTNTPANVSAAIDYVDALQGTGGTHMRAGIQAALEPPTDPDRMRIVLFLTDGYIGNESQVLELLDEMLGEARLFGLGVGSAVNRFLLDKLSEVGRGTVQYVNIDEDPTEPVDAFYRRIRNPVLTDIRIDWGGLAVTETNPAPLPDLFEGHPVVVTGRYDAPASGRVTVSGRLGTRPVSYELDVDLADTDGRQAIPFIWARRKVDALERQHHWSSGPEVRADILPLALEFGLMTQFTSFVAVEERIAVDAADPLYTMAIAVPLPAGVDDERIGTQVSPEYVQPGDPELTVAAPLDTVAVTAYFPFDLVQQLSFDFERGLWTSRFLVPRDFEDGEHDILVAIESEAGEVLFETVPLWVDSTAPSIRLSALPGTTVPMGEVVTFEVRVTTPSWSTCGEADTAPEACASVLPERMKFVRIYLPDGRAVRMSPSEADPHVYAFDFRFRERLGAGDFDVVVEAVDAAGNTTEAELLITVASPVARAN